MNWLSLLPRCVQEAEESIRSEGSVRYRRSASNPSFCYEAILVLPQPKEKSILSVGLTPWHPLLLPPWRSSRVRDESILFHFHATKPQKTCCLTAMLVSIPRYNAAIENWSKPDADVARSIGPTIEQHSPVWALASCRARVWDKVSHVIFEIFFVAI